MHNRTLGFFLILIAVLLGGCSSSWQPENESFLPSNPPTTNSLNVKFLGVSNVYLDDGSHSLLIDGFLSRRELSLSSLIDGMTTDKETVSETLEKANIDSINALLVAHSHYDHVLDTQYISEKMNAEIYGSQLSKKALNSPLFRIVNNGDYKEIGKFKVTFIETPHVEKSNFLEFVEAGYLWVMRGKRFKDIDKNFSFFIEHELGNILIVPSANFKQGAFIGLNADIIFLGIGLLGNESPKHIEQYWRETVETTKAKIVVPIHWDNFSKPLKNDLVGTPDLVDDLAKTISIFKRKVISTPDVGIFLMRPFENINVTDFDTKYNIQSNSVRKRLE